MGERIIHPKFNVHENYKRVNIINPYRYAGGTTTGYEPETVAYMSVIGIADDSTVYYPSTIYSRTGNQIYVAVDNFVKSLKTAGVFAKLKAIYPYIGGTSDKHKWNLKDPRDANDAFRVTWNKTGTHSASGWDGADETFGNSNFIENQYSQLNNASFGHNCKRHAAGGLCDMGVWNGTTGSYILSSFSNLFYSRVQTSSSSTSSNSDSRGFYCVSRINSTQLLSQKNDAITTHSNSSSALIASPFYIGARNNNGTAELISGRGYNYHFIGEGLTQTQMTAHYNAVQQLQTDLGRQV